MTRPASYRKQDGCHNCGHVFVYMNYDQGDQWPLSGSVLMEEEPICRLPNPERHEAYMAWDEWTDNREVEAWGICDEWKRREQ